MTEQAPSKIQRNRWYDLTTSSPVPALSSRRSQTLISLKEQFRKYSLTFLFVFLMSRAMLPVGIFPGAAPCIFAQRRKGYLDQILNGIAVFCGIYSITNLSNALWTGVPLFLLNFFHHYVNQ